MPAAPWSRCRLSFFLGRLLCVPLLCTGMLMVPLTGCSRVKQKWTDTVNNDPQIRSKAIESARSSCITGAEAKAPKDPMVQARIARYCDCFATKGMNTLTNADLMSIAFSGGKLTSQQQGKLMVGVEMCRGELMPAPSITTPRRPGTTR